VIASPQNKAPGSPPGAFLTVAFRVQILGDIASSMHPKKGEACEEREQVDIRLAQALKHRRQSSRRSLSKLPLTKAAKGD
jgi:hypothetical protein